jgi:hypothetical protein
MFVVCKNERVKQSISTLYGERVDERNRVHSVPFSLTVGKERSGRRTGDQQGKKSYG